MNGSRSVSAMEYVSTVQEPEAVAANAIDRHLNRYPRGDPREAKSFDQVVEDIRGARAEQLRDFHRRFYGASHAEFGASGDFDPAALRQALDAVTTAQVLQTIEITHAHFQRLGTKRARIAVAGLNPHAGEGGLFGREEIEVIAPAVAQARRSGIEASGPHAPDTVFMRARQGDFDVVVAMYHDQGLIPVKLLGLEHGVNTTLGLPFVRTSPDHGTAFDLAGTGRASAASLLAAIDAAMAATAP